jgi:hypothetical protein
MLLAMLTAGCVERKFIVTCDTPNTAVYINGMNKETAPVDASFLYYGKYEFRLVDPTGAHATLIAVEPIKPPWYQIPPLDFFAENVYPFKIVDERRLHFTLPEKPRDQEADILKRAQELRQRGQAIGAPRVDGPPPPATPPVPVGPPQP